MKLMVNGLCVNPVLGSAQLEKSRSDAAAALTAALWTAAADTYFLHLSVKLGDVVRLTEDDGTERFLGSIHAITRTPEQVRFTAFDRGIYLSRNEVFGVFAGSGADICRQVAKQLGIGVASIDAKEHYQVISAISGANAFSVLRQAAGGDREIAVENGALTIKKGRAVTFLLHTEHIREVSASADIRGMVNRCVVVDRKGRALASAQNKSDMAACGTFQAVVGKSGSDPAAQAAEGLAGRAMKAEVLLPGNAGYFCGACVRGQQPQWGLEGLYRIEAVCHRWEAGLFTTELTLEGVDGN